MQVALSKTDHDHLIREHALRLVRDGYRVKARLEGWFDAPDYIDGYRPDIVAERNGSFVIVEVKKGAIDYPKIAAFQYFTSQHPQWTLTIVQPPPDK